MNKTQQQDFQHPVVPAMAVSASYYFENSQAVIDYHQGVGRQARYARYDNFGWELLEQQLAALDGAEAAVVFPSGMAAIFSTILALCGQGDQVIYSSKGYRNISTLCHQHLPRYGIQTCPITPELDHAEAILAQIEAQLNPHTRMVLLEAPSNPHLLLTDIRALRALLPPRCLLVIDSTVATPINLQPLQLGADLVLHSLGKYIGGHTNAMAGSVAGSVALCQTIRALRNVNGAICESANVSRIMAGMQTLNLRMRHLNDCGMQVAHWLEQDKRIRRVFYTGLPSHPHAELAHQLRGHGGLISFELDGDLARTMRFVDAVDIAFMATGFGGVHAFIEQPCIFSYYKQSPAERAAAGISDSLVRLALGLDSAEDVIASLARALDASMRNAMLAHQT
ncbi:aminotransferase class I/II-fold pyridoxal phosphate-dependent enzyme [Massilia sp. W12]|uniref:trans-sulfuration enzyme family protein n=1 Tax=Massilia sp. W12 TaxID=3126507 RepID=UPI0030CFC844